MGAKLLNTNGVIWSSEYCHENQNTGHSGHENYNTGHENQFTGQSGHSNYNTGQENQNTGNQNQNTGQENSGKL